jgi:polyvinyl alcohol dehydrogenase (cytochrome)
MSRQLCVFAAALLCLFAPAFAQRADTLFDQNCAACHEIGNAAQAPDRKALRKLTPEEIYQALAAGSMAGRAAALKDDQKRAVAEYIGGRKLGVEDSGNAKHMPNHCPVNPQGDVSPIADIASLPAWNGWGADLANTRFQPAQAAGITAPQVPRLKLKWSFGLPGATSAQNQPTVAGGRVFVSSDTGHLYALDAATGCVYWSFLAQAAVRSSATVGPFEGSREGHRDTKYAVYFGDLKGNVYALDATNGAFLWMVSAEDHPLARITGAPSLYQNRLYVPVASFEEPAGVGQNYPCCTFRGSVVALDASSGAQIWKTYTIPEPQPSRKTSKGVQLYGPAGGGVWDSPTIDPKRHAIYVGTGDAYTEPAPKGTDSILALDIATGALLWSVQDLENDAWMVGCPESNTENCPKNLGPDYDFGSSPILKTLPNGKSVLIAGQKSGDVWAHDPDRKGAVVWKTSTASKAPGPAGQIVWGGTADERNAYFGLNSGGLVALQLSNGERRWFTPLTPPENRKSGQDAAVSAIPGVVFSGGWDGFLRALSTASGKVLWEYDTAQDFKTVNGVAAHGGSIGSAGPTIAGGMVFIASGYPGVRAGSSGNVVLAFAPQ